MTCYLGLPPFKFDIIFFVEEWSKYYDFLQERFQDPKSLVRGLHDNGFKAIWMLDPGIKQEEGYFVYDGGSKNDIWVHSADGTPFVGKVSRS